MGKEHNDIKYLMKDEIGGVLCKGLAETVEANPKNPIEYFAKWLMNYKQTEKTISEVSPHSLHFCNLLLTTKIQIIGRSKAKRCVKL